MPKNSSIFPEWHKNLIVTEKGTAKANIANAMMVLRQDKSFKDSIAFDALREETMVLGELPWNGAYRGPRTWKDNDDRWLAEWFQNNHVGMSVNIVAEAVQAIAAERSFHPVLDYLKTVRWNGEPLLDEWVIRYLGCKDTPYARAVGSRWMISAVARVMQPGCKADSALVLEGKQGTFKSTALRTLAKPWFTDEIAALGSKDAAEQMIGVWIVEFAELDAVTRAADIAHVKAVISRQTDRFRMSYGRRVGEHPRQCVFAATSNTQNWQRDDTGGRRWWPLETGRIDIDGLGEARDQLWAEARDRYEAGEVWWLNDTNLVGAAQREQMARMPEDPIADAVVVAIIGKISVSTAEIMTEWGTPKERQSRADAMRIGNILRALGWQRRRERDGQELQWRYHRTPQES